MTEAKTTSMYRHDNELVIKGNYGRFEFDLEEGTFDVSLDSTLPTFYYDLTIWDYFLRFHDNLEEETQDMIIETFKEHLDLFTRHKDLNMMLGDSSRFKLTPDDRMRAEEAVIEEVDIDESVERLEDVDYEHPIEERIEEFAREAEETSYMKSGGSKEVLREALHDVQEEMEGALEYSGLEELQGRDWNWALHERFMVNVFDVIGEHLPDNPTDEFVEWMRSEWERE